MKNTTFRQFLSSWLQAFRSPRTCVARGSIYPFFVAPRRGRANFFQSKRCQQSNLSANCSRQIIHMCVLLGFKLQRAFSEHGYPELIFNLQKIDLIRIVDIERYFYFVLGGLDFYPFWLSIYMAITCTLLCTMYSMGHRIWENPKNMLLLKIHNFNAIITKLSENKQPMSTTFWPSFVVIA